MSSQDVLHGLLSGPTWTISDGAGQSVFVSVSYTLFVLFGHTVADCWVLAEEGVLQVTGWVTLWLFLCNRDFYVCLCLVNGFRPLVSLLDFPSMGLLLFYYYYYYYPCPY